jgi:hypothetical protein
MTACPATLLLDHLSRWLGGGGGGGVQGWLLGGFSDHSGVKIIPMAAGPGAPVSLSLLLAGVLLGEGLQQLSLQVHKYKLY